MLTVIGLSGIELATIVNIASSPSMIGLPATMLSTGVSLSATLTMADPSDWETV